MLSPKEKMKESFKSNSKDALISVISVNSTDSQKGLIESPVKTENKEFFGIFSLKNPREMNILEKPSLQRQTNRPFDWTPPSIISYMLD
jgi:hypothetical protein